MLLSKVVPVDRRRVRQGGRIESVRGMFDDLPPQAAAKVAIARARLEKGNTSAVKWIGTIGEYRIDRGPGYRVYLAKAGENVVILLGGGTKRRQQADIEHARALWTEYKSRR